MLQRPAKPLLFALLAMASAVSAGAAAGQTPQAGTVSPVPHDPARPAVRPSPSPQSAPSPAPAPMTVQLVLPREAPEPASLVNLLKGVRDNPFLQNVVLLLLTAGITGLLVPKIKSGMDLRYFTDQKRHEAAIARQASLITDQIAFLHSYATVLWRTRFAMIKVSYAFATKVPPDNFTELWKAYEKEMWSALQEQRRLISSSVHLMTGDCFRRLLAFYYEVIIAQEAHLTSRVQSGRHDESDWLHFNQNLVYSYSHQLDEQIVALAKEFNLTVEGAAAVAVAAGTDEATAPEA